MHQLVIKEGSVLLMHGVTMKFTYSMFIFYTLLNLPTLNLCNLFYVTFLHICRHPATDDPTYFLYIKTLVYILMYFLLLCIRLCVLYILFNSVSYVSLLLCLCILIVMYVLFCIFCFHLANWHSSATLTEVFPCFFLSCKANVRV